ncbi:GGDEF domain-containing protein [Sphingomonas sp. UV9]|uniref:GGDEF domain-containing protein n=1 Tax=Sphingomonas sp. UV9 TaxID=1851410 RepID=UPI000FFBBC62|nr:GGDEF domain-containing protein [Sphingomonas sp. UV9]RXD04826.1 GGDEF domain-containing protein [Sphingomonas sp. UV9]
MRLKRTGSYNLIALLGLLSALTLLVCVVVMTRQMDNREADRVRRLLAIRVDADVQSMRTSLAAWAKDDEAVLRLDNARDGEWAASTFRNPSRMSTRIYTFDFSDRIISGAATRPGTRTLRRIESGLPRRIGALRNHLPAEGFSGPKTRVDFFWSDGTLYIFLMAPFSPASKAVRMRHAAPPVLAALIPYKVSLHADLAGMGLEGVDVSNRPTSAAAQPIKNAQGRTVAWIVWKTERPGADLLRTILWPMLALSIAFIILLIFAYRRAADGQRELIASEARANYIAFHDQLTDLANRRYLIDALGRATEKARYGGCDLALLLIDLDRFKLVNDTYGHQCGDELIQETARRLRSVCRDANDLCARLGGDEFVILAQNCDIADAKQMARHVLESLSRPVTLSVATVQSGGSVGVGIFQVLSDSESLLRDADKALYCAKGSGRNTFCVSPENVAPRAAVDADVGQAYPPPAGCRTVHR